MGHQDKQVLTVVRAAAVPQSTMRGAKDEARRMIEEGIPLDKLQQGFARFMDGLRIIVRAGQSEVGEFTLDEISFSAEIGSEGEFKLLGTGVGISATSGVTFTLRKLAPEK